jgi:hypothetical protein
MRDSFMAIDTGLSTTWTLLVPSRNPLPLFRVVH